MTHPREHEQSAIAQVIDRLSAQFPQIPGATVASVVHGAHSRFEGRPVRDYVPLFVERAAARELSGPDAGTAHPERVASVG